MSNTHRQMEVTVDFGDKSTMDDWLCLITPPKGISKIYPTSRTFQPIQIEEYTSFSGINTTIIGDLLGMLHQLVSFTLQHNRGDVGSLLVTKPPLVCPCIINLGQENPFDQFTFVRTELPQHQKNIWVCSSTGAVVDVVIEFALHNTHEFKIFTTVERGGGEEKKLLELVAEKMGEWIDNRFTLDKGKDKIVKKQSARSKGKPISECSFDHVDSTLSLIKKVVTLVCNGDDIQVKQYLQCLSSGVDDKSVVKASWSFISHLCGVTSNDYDGVQRFYFEWLSCLGDNLESQSLVPCQTEHLLLLYKGGTSENIDCTSHCGNECIIVNSNNRVYRDVLGCGSKINILERAPLPTTARQLGGPVCLHDALLHQNQQKQPPMPMSEFVINTSSGAGENATTISDTLTWSTSVSADQAVADGASANGLSASSSQHTDIAEFQQPSVASGSDGNGTDECGPKDKVVDGIIGGVGRPDDSSETAAAGGNVASGPNDNVADGNIGGVARPDSSSEAADGDGNEATGQNTSGGGYASAPEVFEDGTSSVHSQQTNISALGQEVRSQSPGDASNSGGDPKDNVADGNIGGVARPNSSSEAADGDGNEASGQENNVDVYNDSASSTNQSSDDSDASTPYVWRVDVHKNEADVENARYSAHLGGPKRHFFSKVKRDFPFTVSVEQCSDGRDTYERTLCIRGDSVDGGEEKVLMYSIDFSGSNDYTFGAFNIFRFGDQYIIAPKFLCDSLAFLLYAMFEKPLASKHTCQCTACASGDAYEISFFDKRWLDAEERGEQCYNALEHFSERVSIRSQFAHFFRFVDYRVLANTYSRHGRPNTKLKLCEKAPPIPMEPHLKVSDYFVNKSLRDELQGGSENLKNSTDFCLGWYAGFILKEMARREEVHRKLPRNLKLPFLGDGWENNDYITKARDFVWEAGEGEAETDWAKRKVQKSATKPIDDTNSAIPSSHACVQLGMLSIRTERNQRKAKKSRHV